MTSVKKIVPLTLLAFAVYAIVMSPTQAADLVHNLWAITVQAFQGIGSFFNALLQRK